MLSTTTGQVGFFDAAALTGPLPEGSFFSLLAAHGERIVRDEDFADCYADGIGRPSIPPSQLAKVLLLQYRTGLSDEAAMESVAWDLRWKIALGLAVDHTGWSPSSLTRFRARLLLHGKERLALEASLALAQELGMLDAPIEQIVDSTPMLGAAATQDTVRLVRSGVRKLIDAVSAADEDSGRRLDEGLCFDYARPSEKPDCRWRERPERERMLTRVAEDAERALRAVEGAEGLLEADAVKDAHDLLRELIGQDFDVDSDGLPWLHRGTRSDRILSVHDPEIRHGRKSVHRRFDGFKLHASATNSDAPLLTAITVTPANHPDGPQAAALVDSQRAERRPERLLGDTAYGDSATREKLQAREVEVLAPVPASHAREKFRKRDFQIDLDAGTVTCPAAEVAQINAPQRSGKRSVVFRRSVCGGCPLKPRCCPTGSHRQLVIERREDLLLAARRALDDEQAAEHLRRTRPRIERLLAVLAHRYGARKARYLGAAKARLQALWSAALVNLNPIGRRLTAKTA